MTAVATLILCSMLIATVCGALAVMEGDLLPAIIGIAVGSSTGMIAVNLARTL